MRAEPAAAVGEPAAGAGAAGLRRRPLLVGLVVVGGLTAAGRFAGAIRDVVMAGVFGTADVLDAFLIALALPTLGVTVLGGAFQAAVVPAYVSLRAAQGEAAARRFFASAAGWTVALLALVAVLLLLAAPQLVRVVAAGFDPARRAVILDLVPLVLPVLALRGVAAVWGAALNAEERFAPPAAGPVVTPAATVAVLLVGASLGVHALVVGVVAGAALECLVLVPTLRRLGFPLLPGRLALSPALRQAAGQFGSVALGSLILGATRLVDQAVATLLPAGSVSALRYGSLVTDGVLGVAATALGTTVLPRFARLVAEADPGDLRRAFLRYARIVLLVALPVSMVVSLGAPWIVALLFERGAFTAEDTRVVATVQRLYALQIPAYLLGILVPRLISALGANHLLLIGAVVSLVLDLVLDLLLARWLGVAGIALATVLVYSASSIFLLAAVWPRLGRHHERGARA